MVTGAIWEKEVFGRYLFAPAFFWEDFVSMFVIALHTAYLAVLLMHWLDPRRQLLIALSAYCTYAVNAAQFLIKLRAAQQDSKRSQSNSDRDFVQYKPAFELASSGKNHP